MQVSQAVVISLIYHGVNSKKASSRLEEKTAVVSLQSENECSRPKEKDPQPTF